MSKHPRVLHLGFQPIGAPTNSGITLGNMFGGWPEDRLLQVCLREHPAMRTPENAVIAPGLAPVDAFVRRLLGRRVPSGPPDGLNNSVQRSGHINPGTQVRLLATATNDVGPVRLPRDLASSVEDFRPEVLHSLLGGVRAMRLALLFSEHFDIPIVPHFMDDWPENLFRQGQLGGYARRVTERDLDRVLARSPLILSIGTDMQREFEERYGRRCPVVGNSVDFRDYQRPSGRAPGEHAMSLRYVGGLHLGRDEVVRSIARALEGRTAGGRSWLLELFVPSADAARADALQSEFGAILHGGSLAPEKVPDVLAESTALLFVESDAPGIRTFTRLSVSTKVPQYLASGRPVLVVGPQDQGSVRALQRSSTCVQAASRDADALTAALGELESLVGRDGRVDLAWLADEFGTEATRERLRVALSEAAAVGVGA